jgi:hypothetical protein
LRVELAIPGHYPRALRKIIVWEFPLHRSNGDGAYVTLLATIASFAIIFMVAIVAVQ